MLSCIQNIITTTRSLRFLKLLKEVFERAFTTVQKGFWVTGNFYWKLFLFVLKFTKGFLNLVNFGWGKVFYDRFYKWREHYGCHW